MQQENFRRSALLVCRALVPNADHQHAQQVTKAHEILANIAEQRKQYPDVKQHLIRAKDNQKKLLKRLQVEEGDIQKENQKLYCKYVIPSRDRSLSYG